MSNFFATYFAVTFTLLTLGFLALTVFGASFTALVLVAGFCTFLETALVTDALTARGFVFLTVALGAAVFLSAVLVVDFVLFGLGM